MLTTLVVVVVFTPVKNALQSVVDRRSKEIRDLTAPLGAFVARLQDGLWRLEPDLVLKRVLAVSVDSLAASWGVVALAGRTIDRIGGADIHEALSATAAAGSARVTVAVGTRQARRHTRLAIRRPSMPRWLRSRTPWRRRRAGSQRAIPARLRAFDSRPVARSAPRRRPARSGPSARGAAARGHP